MSLSYRNAAGLAFPLLNGKIVESRSGNAVTYAIKNATSGADPSVDEPVHAAFRNSSLADGSYNISGIKDPTSVTVSSGSNLGVANATPFRGWLVLIDDAVPRLGVIVCTTAIAQFVLNEDALISSVAEGGAGGADSAGVVYTDAAVSSKSFRIIGFATYDSGLATAGIWDVAPSVLQMFGPGVKRPGDQVREISNLTSLSMSTGVSFIPEDNTKPQDSEGAELFATNYTAASPANALIHDVEVNGFMAADRLILALFKNSSADAIATRIITAPPDWFQVRLRHKGLAGGASSYSVRAGTVVGSEFLLNSVGGLIGDLRFDGTLTSGHTVTEYMA